MAEPHTKGFDNYTSTWVFTLSLYWELTIGYMPLLSSTKQVEADFLYLVRRRYTGRQSVHLLDGTIVHRGDRIADLHLSASKVPRVCGSYLTYTRSILYPAFAKAMHKLAHELLHNDSLLDLVAVVGRSHLIRGKISKDLGFENFEIADPFIRFYSNFASKRGALIANPTLQNLKNVLVHRSQPAAEGWISRSKWIELHA